MKIPDLSPTELVKNIVGFLVIVATLVLDVNGLEVPARLEIAFWAVIAAYGFSAVKPTISNALTKVYGKPQDAKSDK